MTAMILPILDAIAAQYRLDPRGTHGLNHWGRVLETGLQLAELPVRHLVIIRLFAIFHDEIGRAHV